ncbi:MAG: LOG family protein, partial [Candidatus Bathyarchaeota archaeon]
DIKKDFSRLSTRLDNFMELANAVVVAPGGVGTLLELFYTWQLMQVKMISHIPIILLGDMWPDFLGWIKKWPLKNKFLEQEDINFLYLVDSNEDVLAIIKKAYKNFKGQNQENKIARA